MSNTRDRSDDRPVRGRGWKFMAGFVISGLGLGLAVVGLNPGATSLGEIARESDAGIVTGIGIGLFLAFIGLYETGIVTSFVAGMPTQALQMGADGVLAAPAVPVKIGRLTDPQVLLAVLGFVLMTVLMVRRVRGALLIGIVVTALIGGLCGFGQAPKALAALPFSGDYDLGAIAFKLDIAGVLKASFFPVLLTLFIMSFLDTLGTLTGLGAAAEILDEKGNFPQIERPMLVDALTCMFSGIVGTSTSGAYIESATGIHEGARTGMAALVTAGLFALSLFFIPLIEPLQQLRFAYGPALIAVGVLMIGSVRRIDFGDLTEWVPAFATMVMMVFTYNIANGLTAGLLLHPVLKVAAGRARELNAGMIVLAAMCAAYYLFGLPH